jgi:hypothetical protein
MYIETARKQFDKKSSVLLGFRVYSEVGAPLRQITISITNGADFIAVKLY